MNIKDLDKIVALMVAKGFAHASYKEDGIGIALTIGSSMNLPGAGAAPLPVQLRSPLIGTLLASHPGRAGSPQPPQEGDRVAAGQAVAFVRSGLTLMAVTAPTSGTLGRPLTQPGTVVGYNTPVFEFLPGPDDSTDQG